jgi:predicted ATP-dependent serine protease
MVELGGGTNHLIGRDREPAALESFRGAAGGGETLLLAGEPGVGKTALPLAAAEMAASGGVRVIHRGGVEYESDMTQRGATRTQIDDTLARLSYTTDLVEAVADADLISESVPESMAIKE